MSFKTVFMMSLISILMLSCSPANLPVTHTYSLTNFQAKVYARKPEVKSILVTMPEAVAGYETSDMRYVNKPHELSSFAYNAWTNPPADMIFPLILESLQRSGFFSAVASSPYSDSTEYRLDTQLLRFQQNFLTKPVRFEMSLKVVISSVKDSKVINSSILTANIPCQSANPYGGVIAANIATSQIIGKMTEFTVKSIRNYE